MRPSGSTYISTLLARGLALLGPLGIVIITARLLGPEDRGRYYYVTAISALAMQFASLGLHSSNTYLAARNPALLRGLLTNSIWIAGIGGVLAGGAVIGFELATRPASAIGLPLGFVALLTPLALLFIYLSNLAIAADRAGLFNGLVVLNAVLGLAAVGFVGAVAPGVTAFLIALVAANLIACGVAYRRLAAGLPAAGPFDFPLFKQSAAFGLRAYVATAFGFFMSCTGAIVLRANGAFADLGQWSIAAQIADGLLIVPSTIGLLLFPALVKVEPAKRWAEMRIVLNWLGAAMLAICLVAALLGLFVIPLLFGDAYRPAGAILLALLPGVFFLALTSIVSQLLSAFSFPWSQPAIWVAGWALQLGLSLLAFKTFGVHGLAAIQSASLALVFVALLFLASRHGRDAAAAQDPSVSTLVMSFHPLTKDFAQRLASVVGPSSHYNAARLRNMPLLSGILELRRLRADRIVVAIETESGRPLAAPLSIAAAVTRALSIDVVGPDLAPQRLSRTTVFAGLARVARDTWRAKRALARSRVLAVQLERPAPAAVWPATGQRILYIDANISLGVPVGGAVSHTTGVIGALLRHGFTVDYASAKPLPFGHPGLNWLRFDLDTLLAIPPELNYYAHAEHIAARITRLHGDRPWSFIYQRFSLHNFLAPLLGRRLGVPAVVEFNGSEVWISSHWGEGLAMPDEALAAERTMLRAADQLVTVSEPLAQDLQRLGVPHGRIVTYPNCVDAALFDPRRYDAEELREFRAQHGIPADACLVGYLGTFGQWHGTEFLAECIRDLAATERDWLDRHGVHFVIVGDGQKMPAVRAILDGEHVRRYVTLTGLVPPADARKFLASCTILVSPHVANADGSVFFGSPTKLFEYMAMERPILASSLGQIAEVLSARGPASRETANSPARPCGLLFEPGNAADFKRNLQRLVEDPEFAASLARAARAEVLARYTWERHVDAILCGMVANSLLDPAAIPQPAPGPR